MCKTIRNWRRRCDRYTDCTLKRSCYNRIINRNT
ncbi:MAG: hypothetical protein AB8G11_11825 [Saprospiraceae bacterium]